MEVNDLTGDHDNSNRPSLNDPCFRAVIEVIRNGQLLQPLRRMNISVLDSCSNLLTIGVSVPAEEQARTWMVLQAHIKDAVCQPPRLRRRLILAIMIILLFLLTACAILLPWALRVISDQNRLQMSAAVRQTVSQSGSTRNSSHWDARFVQVLQQSGFNVLLPGSPPDGFSYANATSRQYDESWAQIDAMFISQEAKLFIQIDRYEGTAGMIVSDAEKDEQPHQTIRYGSVDVHIFGNIDAWSAKYAAPPYFVEMTGDVTLAELQQMFDDSRRNTIHETHSSNDPGFDDDSDPHDRMP